MSSSAEPLKYFNRELSWIDFNDRVLQEAMQESTPLLERLKFLGIVSSNFDEFFMVRVASLEDDEVILKAVYEKAFALSTRQHAYFEHTFLPALAEKGITRVLPHALSSDQQSFVRNLFQSEIHSLLTPVAIRVNQPVPALVNLSLYLAVRLADPAHADQALYAVIEIPKNYDRMIALPASSGYSFILLEDIVGMYVEELFSGYEVLEKGLLRITRAAEMTLDDERDEDFAEMMSDALRLRRLNYVLRLEASCSDGMIQYFQNKLELSNDAVFRNNSWFDLKAVSQLAFGSIYPELKREEWHPRICPDFEDAEDIWELIRNKDVLVHHPYESFDCFIRFLQKAAEDPDVMAIKQTLYRAADPSRIVSLLERAADNGKQVTVLIELKARFDERKNIEWARRLRDAGANVIYGVTSLKTHAKVCLVIRRDIDGIRRYVHLGTGNYNEKTARIYSDIGYFSCDELLTRDLSSFFNVVTGFSEPLTFAKISMSPDGIRKKIMYLIKREMTRAENGQKAKIIAKFNSLVDSKIIEALYEASNKGVKIKLNVRGICCLVPGVPGQSENIQVVSIVDMFLEHSRMFYFYNGGAEEIFLSSADWMPRNLDRRVELMFPIDDAKHKSFLIDLLKKYFQETSNAWVLQPNGEYLRKQPKAGKVFRIQQFLCDNALRAEKGYQEATMKEYKPKMPKRDILKSKKPKKDDDGDQPPVKVIPPIK